MTEVWVDRYEPQSWDEIAGNNKALKSIRNWLEDFRGGDQPRLLAGQRGTGKTTTARVASRETGYPIEEINASSARKTEDLKSLASRIDSKPMGHEHKIVFIDEADSLSGMADLQPLYDALDSPKNPILVAVNKKWETPDGLKNRCKIHDFKLGKRSIKSRLKDIVEQEEVDISNKDLGQIATRDDLRSAIQDLQAYADGVDVGWNDREMESSSFDVMDNVLRAKNYIGNDMVPPDFALWLDENVSKSFDGLECAVAYDAISRADKWNGRASSNDYTWWAYSGALTEQVANLRRTEPYNGYIQKSFPTFFRSSQDRHDDGSSESKLYQSIKEDEAYEFSGNYHYFRKVLLPILQGLSKDERRKMAVSYGVDEGDVDVLDLDPDEYSEWKSSSQEIQNPSGITDL